MRQYDEVHDYISASEAKIDLACTFSSFKQALRNFFWLTFFGERGMNAKIKEIIDAELFAEQEEFKRNHIAEKSPGVYVYYDYTHIKEGATILYKKILHTDVSPLVAMIQLFKKHRKADYITLHINSETHIMGQRVGNKINVHSKDMKYKSSILLTND